MNERYTPVELNEAYLPLVEALHVAHMTIARRDDKLARSGNRAYQLTRKARHDAFRLLFNGNMHAVAVLEQEVLDESGEGVEHFARQVPGIIADICLNEARGWIIDNMHDHEDVDYWRYDAPADRVWRRVGRWYHGGVAAFVRDQGPYDPSCHICGLEGGH